MKNRSSKPLLALISLLMLTLLYFTSSIFIDSDEERVIYFISKTSSENDTFWLSMQRGAEISASENNVKLVFVGPEREVDLDHQVELVKTAIDSNPLAIILAASDYSYLAEISEEAIEENITFVTVDSDVDISSEHSFIATDNVAAASVLADELATMIDYKGTVLLVSHLEGTTSAIDRENGFIDGISKYQDINLVSEIPYSNNYRYIALEKTTEQIENNPEITAIFATNEETLIGAAMALDELNLSSQITLVGFDFSKEAAIFLEEGIIKKIVIQKPFNMGYLSVEEAIRLSDGNKKDYQYIDTNVILIDHDNMFDYDNQKLLIPFLE